MKRRLLSALLVLPFGISGVPLSAQGQDSAPAYNPAQLDLAQLTARFALPSSQFATIDGTQVHYVDEGRGPAILLLHGSFASLRQWDGWASRLKRRYRVIRFDMPPAGLSGTMPTADYTIDHKLKLIEQLAGKLGIRNFILVATSSAGVPGAAFAAAYPQMVDGFIFNNSSVGALKVDPAGFSPELRQAVADDAKHPGWHENNFWRQIMRSNFADPAKVSERDVQQWTDLNNRPIAPDKAPSGKALAAEFLRTPDDLKRIEVPSLVLWSAKDHEVPVEREGRLALQLIKADDKAMAIIPDCGHMMPNECGDEGLNLSLPFIRRVADRLKRKGR